MIDAALGHDSRAERDGSIRAVTLVEVAVPVAVEPGFQVAGIQLDDVSCVFVTIAEFKVRAVREQVVVEDDLRLLLWEQGQQVLQPGEDPRLGVGGLKVTVAHGCDHKQHVAFLKGIAHRADVRLEELLAIVAGQQVVVAEAGVDRCSHGRAGDVAAVPVDTSSVAQVTRVKEECGPCVAHKVLQFV